MYLYRSSSSSSSASRWSRSLLLFASVLMFQCMIPVFVAAQGGDNENNKGEKDFKTAGFPTITMIAGPMLLAFSIYSGASIGGGQPAQYKLFCVLHLFLLFCGIIFTFGPGGVVPVPILGLHLWFLVLLSIHIVLTNRVAVKSVYLAFGLFTLAAFTGSMPFFSYIAPIFTVNRTACLTYFSETDINRCEDKGFLQLIRTLGAVCIFVIYLTLTLVYLDWASPAVTSSSSSSSSSTSSSSSPSAKTAPPTEPLLSDHHHDHDHQAESHVHTTSYQSGEVH